MAYTAQSIFTRVGIELNDPNNIRWPVSELTMWLNDGQRVIAQQRPDASVTTQSIQLTANSTRQPLPVNAVRLMDVTRNMGLDGATPGQAITFVEKRILDQQHQSWHSDVGSTTIFNFIYDVRNPLVFYVYPRPPASPAVYVEAILAVNPADVVNPTDPLSINDIYVPFLLNYVCAKCYEKDAEYAGNGPRAQYHMQMFESGIGAKTRGDLAVAPQSVIMPVTPQAQAGGGQ